MLRVVQNPRWARLQSRFKASLRLLSTLGPDASFDSYQKCLSDPSFLQKIPPQSANDTIKSHLIDAIAAAKQERLLDKEIRSFLLNPSTSIVANVLHSKTTNEEILKKYLLTKPIPSLKEVYRLITGLVDQASSFPLSDNMVKVAIRVALNSPALATAENFQVLANLVSETFGSRKYVESVKQHVYQLFVPKYVLALGGTEIAATQIFKYGLENGLGVAADSSHNISLMLGSYLLNTSFLGFMAILGLYNNKTVRVKWGEGANMWYKFLHHREITMYERIFTQYEELYDLNMDHYTLIGGNKIDGEKNIVNLLETALEEPSVREERYDSEVDGTQIGEKQKLLRFFKQLFERRRMKIEDYTDQEMMFQEYWMTGGQNYEWVEPDQDPGEILLRERMR